MKQINKILPLLFVSGALLAAPAWQQQVGTVAQDSAQTAAIAKTVPPADYAAFVAEVVKAVDALPLAPEAKVARLTQLVRQVIAASPAARKADTIAAIYAAAPISSLAAVNETLARAFDRQRNKLTEAQFQAIAANILKRTADAVSKAEFPVARMSAALAVFQAAGPLTSEQASKLADDVLPSTFNKPLVVEVANEAAKGNYNPLQDMTDAKMVLDPASRSANDARKADNQLLATPPVIFNPVKTDSTQGQMLLSALATQALPPVGVGMNDLPGLTTVDDPQTSNPRPDPSPDTPEEPPTPPPYQGQTH